MSEQPRENEATKVLNNVDGGDPGVTRDSVEKARRNAPEQSPGLPLRPPETGNARSPSEGPTSREGTDAQNASGGAKEEFETAADDREGFRKIREGFEMGGRDNAPDLPEDETSKLPADGHMNQEARGRGTPNGDE
jgi:hypothetical protein